MCVCVCVCIYAYTIQSYLSPLSYSLNAVLAGHWCQSQFSGIFRLGTPNQQYSTIFGNIMSLQGVLIYFFFLTQI